MTHKKNPNGFGNIRKRKKVRKDGTTYEYWEGLITIKYDPISKKQQTKSFTGSTQAEVVSKMRSFGSSVNMEDDSPKENSLTLQNWMDIWRKEYLTAVKPSTAYNYERCIALYIVPSLGTYTIDKITPLIVQRFYNQLLEPVNPDVKPLAPKTVKDIHGVLHQALEQAFRNGDISCNPTSGCKLPKVSKKEIRPLEDGQLAHFLELIEGHTHEYLFKITLFTGMREGEVLGLTWDDIDFQRGELHITKQLRREQKKGGEYYFSTPKNGKGRIIALSPSVVKLFKLQKQKEALKQLEAGDNWINSQLIFTNPCGDRLSYRTVYDCFKRVVREMGHPELRFHDLRHQFAVISLQNGDDIKTVQHNLGHATAAFTLDVYGHITDRMRKDSAARMENYISYLNSY